MDKRILDLAEQLRTFPWSSEDEPISGTELVDALAGRVMPFLAAVDRELEKERRAALRLGSCPECGRPVQIVSGLEPGTYYCPRCETEYKPDGMILGHG